ncbi:MAG: CRTAC1 family protein [Paracoccaceae bacterium]
MRPRVLTLIALLPAIAAAQTPVFMPRAIPPHAYTGGWEHFVGGGVAAFDCNGDGLPDLYVAGGEAPAQLMRNTTAGAGAALAFVADTPDALALTGVTGAYPLDIDGDGLLDLVILRVGADLLMRGQGNCAFTPFETLQFESGDHWTTAFSATWEAGQSLPTLAFGSYVDRVNPEGPFEACDATLLYRPEGEHYAPARRLEPGYCALSALFTDWNRTGRADLRLSNDRHYYVRGGQEQLWAMEQTPRLYTEAEGWARFMLWGMGIAARDMNGDGFADVYLTSMGDQKFQLFNPASGGPHFEDATFARGTTAHRPYTGGDGRPSTGWHAAFGDVNNDGRDDIFVAKGNVEQMADAAMDDPNNLLVQGADGQFVEMGEAAGIASLHRARGAALMDFNADGRLDLLVVNRRENLELYENQTAGGNWLSVDLGTGATGAIVELRSTTGVQTQEVTVGGGHASGQWGPLHFGLGAETHAEIRVQWRGEAPGEWHMFSANQLVYLALSR